MTAPDLAGRQHKGGPDTEGAAAASMIPSKQRMQDQVLATLEAAYPNGLTDDEGAALLCWRDRLSFGRRRQELCEAGKVVDSGSRRHNPDTGRSAVVWRVPNDPRSVGAAGETCR